MQLQYNNNNSHSATQASQPTPSAIPIPTDIPALVKVVYVIISWQFTSWVSAKRTLDRARLASVCSELTKVAVVFFHELSSSGKPQRTYQAYDPLIATYSGLSTLYWSYPVYE